MAVVTPLGTSPVMPGAATAADWTDEQKARLRRLWADGETTAAIGQRLGVSKNAVCGKAHRMHLTPRDSPIRPARLPCAAPNAAKVAAPKPPKPKIYKQRQRRGRVTQAPNWAVSRHHTCQFPLWDNEERPTHVYCGAPTVMRPRTLFVDGHALHSDAPTSYCADHYLACYEPLKPAGDARGPMLWTKSKVMP